MRLILIFLSILLGVTACAAPAPPNSTDIPTSESDLVVVNGTFETSLLATEWKGGSEGSVLFPFDPASGTALPGYLPIPLGYFSSHAFSPDRSILAVVSFPTETPYNGSLLRIDLAGWKTQSFELELIGWVNSIVFSADGRRLAIAHGQSSYKITVFDLEQGLIITQRQTDSLISRMKFIEDGTRLMLYSPAIYNGLSAGPPKAILLDAIDLSPLWTVELEHVRDGIFSKDENSTPENIHEPGQAYYISPGLTFAPDRDALYIVHADSEELTTVNFESQTVETVEIQTKLTWFERLLSLTAGAAHAKIGDGTIRQAVVSPDGQFLYVVGVNNITSQDQYGNWQMEQTPLGLEIHQTSDGSLVKHFETDTTELSLSPDGRFLYLRNWGSNQTNIPWTEIFDTSSRQVVAREEKISGMPALLMNGELLLVSTYSTGETSHHMSVLQPDGSSVLAEWTSTKYVWWLTTP